MRQACAKIRRPMMANMADGGKTPIRSKAELEAIGYRVAIFPATTGLAAAYAAEVALSVLKETGTSISPTVPLFSFSEFNSLIGFEDVWEFERKWGAAG
jgi:2-methylisocitrate lyase-like PEP mutase family enzyme